MKNKVHRIKNSESYEQMQTDNSCIWKKENFQGFINSFWKLGLQVARIKTVRFLYISLGMLGIPMLGMGKIWEISSLNVGAESLSSVRYQHVVDQHEFCAVSICCNLANYSDEHMNVVWQTHSLSFMKFKPKKPNGLFGSISLTHH